MEKTFFSIAELIKKLFGNFVHQNIISYCNFEGIDELMGNSFKIKSLLHKLPLNWAAGKDGIFADSSVCNHLSSLFNVCLMHGKIPQECMQTVIVPICKSKNGNISDAGNYRPVSLQLSSPSCLNTTSCHAFLHFWPQQTTSLASSQNMALTSVFFYLNRLCLIM